MERKTRVSYNGIYQERAERRIRLNRMRRARELRMKMVLFSVALLLGTLLAIGCNSNKSNAKSSEDVTMYKYYFSYQIQAGDSLTSIAQIYNDGSNQDIKAYVKEVMSINHIQDGERIYAGDYLVIPYYSSEFRI